MKLQEAKKIKQAILDVYEGRAEPSSLEGIVPNYMEELYPAEEGVYVGEWISSRFGVNSFFDLEVVKRFYDKRAKTLRKILFYCNFNKVPGGEVNVPKPHRKVVS